MEITTDTVKYVAHLARIELKAQEIERFAQQLCGILEFVETLNKVEIKDIAPTTHILAIKNVLREDLRRESLPLAKTLRNAPAKVGDYFAVPKVIE